MAVSSSAGIYVSTNSGTTWTQTNPSPIWTAVACSSDGTKGVAVTLGSGIYTSTNSGGTWNLSYSSLNTWSAVASTTNASILVATSQGNGIYISTNSGASWSQSYNSPLSWTGIAIDSTGQFISAVSNGSGIYTSLNGGGSWSQTLNVPNNFSGIASSYGSQQVAVANQFGGSNGVQTSINSGATWTNQNIGILQINAVASDSTGTNLVLVTSGNGIYTSTNSGVTWGISYASPNFWSSVASSSNGANLVATVSGGGIYTLSGSVPCFKEGTRILCLIDNKEEYIPIENIRKGVLVKTHLHGYIPVNMIGTSTIDNPSDASRIKNRLYRCSREKYPELFEDLIITGCHSILVDELSEEEKEKTLELLARIYITDDKYRLMACIDKRADVYEIEGNFNIWHLALDNDNYYENYGIYANCLLVETTSKRYLKELSKMTLIN
jgi:hypothetical protein